ncbi:hypothetical protein [Paraglaciecola sp.]|uniref:hypothetical protein n=1 Tax=Paraglaciecola sp. TaxID=1920173 RepID=UPI0030F42967
MKLHDTIFYWLDDFYLGCTLYYLACKKITAFMTGLLVFAGRGCGQWSAEVSWATVAI